MKNVVKLGIELPHILQDMHEQIISASQFLPDFHILRNIAMHCLLVVISKSTKNECVTR